METNCLALSAPPFNFSNQLAALSISHQPPQPDLCLRSAQLLSILASDISDFDPSDATNAT